MRLSEKLKQEAIDRGLCLQWQSEWAENTSREELIRKFVSGIDFCIAHDWPKKEFVKRWFGDIMHGHGIYVDEDVAIEHASGTLVFLGRCTGYVSSDDYAVADIYVFHDSDLQIVSRDNAKVFVNKSADAQIEPIVLHSSSIKEYIIKTGEANGSK